MAPELRIPIEADGDIVVARKAGRDLAAELSFGPSDLTVIAAAISEVARNIYSYARRGEIRLKLVEQQGRRGIEVVAVDSGPGIVDVELAFQDGYSTSGSLGLGLPGVRRLMDVCEVQTGPGQGTTVLLRKWAK